MSSDLFTERKKRIEKEHDALMTRQNEQLFSTNGVYSRYANPILTRDHVPLHWRFDFNPATNPRFMERIGFNADDAGNSIIRRRTALIQFDHATAAMQAETVILFGSA